MPISPTICRLHQCSDFNLNKNKDKKWLVKETVWILDRFSDENILITKKTRQSKEIIEKIGGYREYIGMSTFTQVELK